MTWTLETKGGAYDIEVKRKVKKPFWEALRLLQKRLSKNIGNEINCLAALTEYGK
jgi:hypothetical protein